jgi:hypothetical protein
MSPRPVWANTTREKSRRTLSPIWPRPGKSSDVTVKLSAKWRFQVSVSGVQGIYSKLSQMNWTIVEIIIIGTAFSYTGDRRVWKSVEQFIRQECWAYRHYSRLEFLSRFGERQAVRKSTWFLVKQMWPWKLKPLRTLGIGQRVSIFFMRKTNAEIALLFAKSRAPGKFHPKLRSCPGVISARCFGLWISFNSYHENPILTDMEVHYTLPWVGAGTSSRF